MFVNSITNLNEKTFIVGQRVTHCDGWKGIITKINEATGKIYVQPDNVEEISRPERYLLNPEAAARHGFPDFCRARDHGMSMGNYREAW